MAYLITVWAEIRRPPRKQVLSTRAGDVSSPLQIIGGISYSFHGAMPSFLRTFSIVRWAMAEARSRPESMTCCR